MKEKLKDAWEIVCGIFTHTEKEADTKAENRRRVVYVLLGVFFFAEIGGMYYNSAIVEGVNKTADLYKTAAITEADMRTIKAGDILDRNQIPLVTAVEEKEEKKTKDEKVKEKKKKAQDYRYADSYAYTQLLGWTGPAKLVKGYEISDSQKEYRLMEYYREQLYETVNIDDKKGNTLTLTLDHQLQMKVKELLMKEMRVSDKGSAIILDAKTGEILSMISFPSWDANDLDNSITKMNHAPMEEEAFYPITHKGGEVPGSIFKIIMAVSMIDNGLESFMAKDTEFNAGPAPIRNDYGSKDEIIDYKQALIRSSNVFFAKAALEMGGKSLTETAEKFMIGKDLELDFGTVNSNWNLNPKSKSDIAYTAFGQGKTLFSTISAAQMMGAIANDGLMLTPYLVQTIGNEKNGEIYTGEPKELSQVTSKETADKVTEVLKETARSYIPAIEGRKNQEVFEKYSIACKTGTGERGDKEDSNNAWAVSFAPADDPEYVVVVNQCKTKKYGRHMLDTTAGIYRYLFEEYKK